MIVVTSERTMLSGTKIDLQVEFTCLVDSLLRKQENGEPVLTKEELDYCVSLASMPKDELHKQAEDAFENILNRFMSDDTE